MSFVSFGLANSILATKEDIEMAGKGKKFDFHGSFAKKEDAKRKEEEVNGFIREHKIDGKLRYFVLTVRKDV